MLAVVLLHLATGGLPARAADSAVVIMYHRFGEAGFPATNIRTDQFDAHLEELKSGGYSVLPLPEIVAKLQAGGELPERTVALSIDDAFLSVYEVAWPRLKRAGLPFTLFVATDPIDRGGSGYMSWDQIRELAAGGVTIGSQTASHPHMAAADPVINGEDLRRSSLRLEAELGMKPTLFAYPYGEASLAARRAVIEAGFAAAFGQHSGGMHRSGDPYFLPRFPFNEAYGDLGRFRLVANSLPLPVGDVTPADPTIRENPPAFGFTVDEGVENIDGIACYTARGAARVERLGERRIEVRLADFLPPGRARVNCTTVTREGRWRWFGTQFFVPERTG